MDDGGLFLRDVVMPGGKRCTRTVVSRTLVGEPGSTYRYLGLRLFSHPWRDVDDAGDATTTRTTTTGAGGGGGTLRDLGYSPGVASALLSMGNANASLITRTSDVLDSHVSHNRVGPGGMVGSAEYNLTLVNKMEPDAAGTKRDHDYGMGKVSVGWHRDSGLQDFSSIAVYQTLTTTNSRAASKSKKTGKTTTPSPKMTHGDNGVSSSSPSSSSSSSSSWGVALRAMDGGSGGPLQSIPALLVPLPSKSVYYMLDDFNHNHEHAVISPSGRGGGGGGGDTTTRYSSTHRVAREGRGTWQYIRDKARGVVASSSATISNDASSSSSSSRKEREAIVSRVRAQQGLMTEIEFDWLRQWHVQGRRHASLHTYWHGPIRHLCDVYSELECATCAILDSISREDDGGKTTTAATTTGGGGREQRWPRAVTEDLFDVLIESLTERSALRASWRERYRDPIYADIPEDERPFPCPCLDRQKGGGGESGGRGGLPEDLDSLVSRLRRWRSAFVISEEEKFDVGREGGGDGGVKTMTGAKELKGRQRGKTSKSAVGSLTKKESKQRASNWERLRANLKK
jgi:alpha-ketoglutarate-dependent dioxygenase FTO